MIINKIDIKINNYPLNSRLDPLVCELHIYHNFRNSIPAPCPRVELRVPGHTGCDRCGPDGACRRVRHVLPCRRRRASRLRRRRARPHHLRLGVAAPGQGTLFGWDQGIPLPMIFMMNGITDLIPVTTRGPSSGLFLYEPASLPTNRCPCFVLFHFSPKNSH